MLVIAKNIGDSRIVENIHQHGRDLYRTSKTNSLSNTAVMSNALRSGVLEQRKVDMVSFDAVAKAMGPTWNEKWKGSVASSLRSKGTPMTKQIQRLMLPQSKKMSFLAHPSTCQPVHICGCHNMALLIGATHSTETLVPTRLGSLSWQSLA